ncbi:unnamed protein product, partial [Mesorhabditis belari]|uniref:Uncharacterized protein n=1 Tax=Mesorhabditis belari TaxID=2138241 RepID=A0AAF3EHK8_9BILA
MKKLKKSGKASRAEILLMYQMIITSIMVLLGYSIVYQMISIIVNALFGFNLYNAFTYLTSASYYFFFHFYNLYFIPSEAIHV